MGSFWFNIRVLCFHFQWGRDTKPGIRFNKYWLRWSVLIKPARVSDFWPLW